MAKFFKSESNNIVATLALQTLDTAWTATLKSSFVLRVWFLLKRTIDSFGFGLTRVGSAFQLTSFLLMAIIFLILAAPQFANDKGVLAGLVAISLLLRLGGHLIGGKEKYHSYAIDMLVMGFLAINIISCFASHYLLASVKGLVKQILYISSYFLFLSGLQLGGRRRILMCLSLLVVGGVLVACYGLYQYKIGVPPLATWEDPTVENKAIRIYSTLNNPNLLAGYLVPLVPISASLFMLTITAKGWWRLLSLPALASIGLIALALVLTGSRGGYLGFIATVLCLFFTSVVWLWKQKPRARIALAFGFCLLMLVLCLLVQCFPTLEQRFFSIFVGREHSSNSYRLNVWQASWQMFLSNWWIGVGPGNETFRLAYGLYMISGFDALGTYCVPLEVAVELGAIGLILFVSLLIVVLARAHQIFWQTTDIVKRWLVAGAASALIGLMFHGLVDTVFYRPQVQLIFWLMIAVLMALQHLSVYSSVSTSADVQDNEAQLK